MKTLNDIRTAIKPLGFNVKTKSFSWGKSAIYVHAETGQELNFNVFTPETLARWLPLTTWRSLNKDALKGVRENTGIIGLI